MAIRVKILPVAHINAHELIHKLSFVVACFEFIPPFGDNVWILCFL